MENNSPWVIFNSPGHFEFNLGHFESAPFTLTESIDQNQQAVYRLPLERMDELSTSGLYTVDRLCTVITEEMVVPVARISHLLFIKHVKYMTDLYFVTDLIFLVAATGCIIIYH